jgi:hypothetical protein
VFAAPRQTALDLNIAVSLARKELSAAAQSEVEYRRSVRQVSLGMTPAVLISTAAAVAGSLTGSSSDFSRVGISLACLIAGITLVCGLMSTAAYQENVAQSLLLDVAFIRYWELRREDLIKDSADPAERPAAMRSQTP